MIDIYIYLFNKCYFLRFFFFTKNACFDRITNFEKDEPFKKTKKKL